MKRFSSNCSIIGLIAILLLFNFLGACAQANPSLRDILRERREQRRERRIERTDNNNLRETPGQLVVQRMTRTYTLYTPSSYSSNKPMPLVIGFHGGYQKASRFASTTGFDSLAEREGFLMVYPDGIDRHWNDGRGTTNTKIDDVAFVEALINKLKQIRNVDSRRIYVTGISNGGYFVQLLACRLSDKIAAFAPVAATFPVPLQASCQPTNPISILMFNSPDDTFVPWNGGLATKGKGGEILSVPATVQLWKNKNNCTASKEQQMPAIDSNDVTRVKRTLYFNCRGKAEIILYTIEGGGHSWPGGREQPRWLVGLTSQQINASDEIWKFFQRHSLP